MYPLFSYKSRFQIVALNNRSRKLSFKLNPSNNVPQRYIIKLRVFVRGLHSLWLDGFFACEDGYMLLQSNLSTYVSYLYLSRYSMIKIFVVACGLWRVGDIDRRGGGGAL